MEHASYKGIVLAGGNGTRLRPLTKAISKQLLPVYDKPLIYYPLSVLMLAGIRDILVISSPRDLPLFQKVLGDGSNWGLSLSYAEQANPSGIAEALIIGKEFIDNANVALVLGDNIFFGHSLTEMLRAARHRSTGATIFTYPVQDPARYGVVVLDEQERVLELEEKPDKPKSNLAVTGLYFYDKHAPDYAASLRPSLRGELEITDLNNRYLAAHELYAVQMGRGAAWFDAGTPEALLAAGEFVRTIQCRQGLQIACLEEIAFKCGYINFEDLQQQARLHQASEYGLYLTSVVAAAARDADMYGSLRTDAPVRRRSA